jgi:hypothetical protein
MIVRNKNGDLIKINKYDYPNDMIYYEKIMNIKKEFTKERYYENNSINKNKMFFTPTNCDANMNQFPSQPLQKIYDFLNIEY